MLRAQVSQAFHVLLLMERPLNWLSGQFRILEKRIIELERRCDTCTFCLKAEAKAFQWNAKAEPYVPAPPAVFQLQPVPISLFEAIVATSASDVATATPISSSPTLSCAIDACVSAPRLVTDGSELTEVKTLEPETKCDDVPGGLRYKMWQPGAAPLVWRGLSDEAAALIQQRWKERSLCRRRTAAAVVVQRRWVRHCLRKDKRCLIVMNVDQTVRKMKYWVALHCSALPEYSEGPQLLERRANKVVQFLCDQWLGYSFRTPNRCWVAWFATHAAARMVHHMGHNYAVDDAAVKVFATMKLGVPDSDLYPG